MQICESISEPWLLPFFCFCSSVLAGRIRNTLRPPSRISTFEWRDVSSKMPFESEETAFKVLNGLIRQRLENRATTTRSVEPVPPRWRTAEEKSSKNRMNQLNLPAQTVALSKTMIAYEVRSFQTRSRMEQRESIVLAIVTGDSCLIWRLHSFRRRADGR